MRSYDHHDGPVSTARHRPTERADVREAFDVHRIRTALRWIHAHLGDRIRSKDIAAAAGTSLRTLHRDFSTYVGTAPAAYVRRARLAWARAQLRAGTPADTTVTDVAWRTGHADLGWFSRRYKATYGEAPVETLRAAPVRPAVRPGANSVAANRQAAIRQAAARQAPDRLAANRLAANAPAANGPAVNRYGATGLGAYGRDADGRPRYRPAAGTRSDPAAGSRYGPATGGRDAGRPGLL